MRAWVTALLCSLMRTVEIIELILAGRRFRLP